MPIIKSAKKKVRQDKKRARLNRVYEIGYKVALDRLKKRKGDPKKLLQTFYSKIDKALKKKIIHKNKARRLKSQAAKIVKEPRPKKKTNQTK